MRQEYDIELKDFQKDYLAGITEKYDLPDMGKAIRCLIDYAIEMEEQEIEIFKLERCHSCDWFNDYFRLLNPTRGSKTKEERATVTEKKQDPDSPKVDMDNLYGSWKYAKITSEHVTKAVAKMNKDHQKKEKISEEPQKKLKPIKWIIPFSREAWVITLDSAWSTERHYSRNVLHSRR